VEAKSKKALVIRLSSLGDVVLSTSTFAPLRAAGFEVCFLSKAAFAPLLQGHKDLVEVFSFDKKIGEEVATRQLKDWFEKNQFELVLDLQNSWRTWRWGFWMGSSALVVRLPKERLREFAILFFRLGSFLSFQRGGRAKKFREFTRKSLGQSEKLEHRDFMSFSFSSSETFDIPSGDFVTLVPVSAWEGKQWPYFESLAKRLSKNFPVVVLGGEKDFHCDQVALAAGARGFSLRGKTTLAQSAYVLQKSRWVIGNDTGMLHVAEALGRDVAMIEGPTHETMGFSPYREKSLLLGLSLFCRPCSKSGKYCLRGGTRKCLNDLSVDIVIEKLKAWGLPC